MVEKDERNRPARPVIWSLMISFASMLVISLAGIVYTGYVQGENNKQWCKTLIAIDDAYSQANITSPAGRHIAEEFHNLRVEFGC